MTEAIDAKLYDGEVTLRLTKSHRYYVQDEGKSDTKQRPMPGVTTVSGMLDKPALVRWAANMCGEYLKQNWRDLDDALMNTKVSATSQVAAFADRMIREHHRIKEEAGDLGSQVHDYAEAWGRWEMGAGAQPEIPTDPHVRQGVEAFHDWLGTHHVKFLACEKLVYSRRYEYAGKFDLLCEMDGIHTLADYKTSKGWYADFFLQLAGYRRAHEEESGEKIGRAVGLHFDKFTGAFTPHYAENPVADDRAFRACRELYRWGRAKEKEK